MKKLIAVAVALAPLCLSMSALAEIHIETVTVGDPGNVDYSFEFGSVAYTYDIGKYEVTASQYTAFLNAVAKTDLYGLYNENMWSNPRGCKIERSGSPGNYSYSVATDYANRPVNYVSYWDSCRFANWLSNGQKTGQQDPTTTENGTYALNGYNGTFNELLQRKSNWTWAVASDAEWFKAAYYAGGGTNMDYWLYPTQSNSIPGRDLADAAGNNANYYDNGYLVGSPYYLTEVGEFQNSKSAYGTFDQGGNVWEWTEAVRHVGPQFATRGQRGGSFDYTGYGMQASRRGGSSPINETYSVGFRVSNVPEPSAIITLAVGLTSLVGMSLRKR